MNSHSRSENNDRRDPFASSLGLFSIGLGLAEIFAHREVARLIGVKDRPNVFIALGIREIVSGIGILAQKRPTGWLWSRVAGDVMDLSLLGVAFTESSSDKPRVEGAAAAVAGVMLADTVCALQHSRASGPFRVEKVIAVDRPPEELYEFWRRFDNLPRFMRNLESVRVVDGRRSHWVARGPGTKSIHWDAEIVDERPGEFISWRSLPGGDISTAGSVRFERAPGGRGTFVRVQMQYDPPGGFLGASIAKLLGANPDTLVQRDLYRFKQVMETGQVITTEGQPAARASSPPTMYDTDNVRR